ncbi:YHS domain-containing protein [Flavihumibacter rivuli]|uniref:YHS domain-containing protein n=1 Tax=Flavihumibacter rivuli TaxID=2838156 RepID=UPI001BDEC6F8|nr:YHS domain-containing protein [Flavihumibacter rivuli]ULQ55889.1 YHS domain-containing protein [Flavihumibacter rivuli]
MGKHKEIAILMADLTGYTAMTEVHGAESAMQIVGKYLELAQLSMAGTSRLLERVGDQLVIIAENPDDLANTALNLVDKCTREPEFLMIHAGLHFGEVLENNGSFFGSAMNITARIAAHAGRGKILCSKDFINNIASPGNYCFESPREITLKNIMQPIMVAELVSPNPALSEWMHIDPVCHMQVQSNTPHRYALDQKIFHFCSDQCREIFIRNSY